MITYKLQSIADHPGDHTRREREALTKYHEVKITSIIVQLMIFLPRNKLKFNAY